MKRMLFQILLVFVTSPALAQVSSENYVQTTQRISDTQVLTTTQYYDGLGRPFEKVEQRVTPSGDNLIHLQQYDGLGREWRNWNPIYSSSAFLNPSDVSSLSQSQYDDSHAFSQNNYESNPLNRVVEVEGIGEDWKGHSIKSDHLINTSSFPLNCKYYRVSMSGELQAKGYYPEGRLYVTKSTDEDGHESYEFKNLAGHVILQRVMLSGTESADTYYIYDYCGNLAFVLPPNYQDEEDLELYAYQYKYDGRGNCIWKKLPGCEPIIMKYYREHHLAFMQDGNLRKQGQWLFSQYYGKKGRVVQSHSSNLLGGWEHTYSSYTYAGSLLQTKHVHTANGKQEVVEEYDYAYDHVGRLVKTTYSVNGSDKRDLSVVDYDNYGRILLENIMGKDEVLYDYNVQNMLTDSGYNEGDRLNDWQGNYDESLSYDKMGNVQSLLRSGLLDDGSYGLIDNLSYSYHGNQLLKVDDAANGPYYQGAFHFVDGADEAVEYEYDANGNMVRDLNKGIISISYDLNNQPRKIEYSDGRNASYVYDAEGNKLSVSYNLTAMSSAQPQMPVMQSSNVASANVSNGQKTIDYCGNIIYDGNETMILNDVGYALYNKDNNLSFYYYLKDHLGNNRVVVSEYGEIEQVNDYYPTGALMTSSKGGDTQRFKYNGKELDRTNGLNWYGYGARNYDAAIVRWDGMDKLCEKYSPFTPYGYCLNRFLNYYDKIGNEPGDFFLSKNAAAMDFGLFYNGISILEKREYISPIVAVSDKYGNSGYTYLWPSVGTEYKSKISSYPLGHPVAALVHTHGNFSAYTDNYFSGQLTRRGKTRLLSERELKLVINSPNMPTDIGTSNKLGKEVYLVSPNGQLQKYNPKDGKILKISNQMPSDPQDPSRKNQKLLNIKRVDFMDYLTKVFKLFINPQKF